MQSEKLVLVDALAVIYYYYYYSPNNVTW